MSDIIRLGVGAVVFQDDCVLLVNRKNPPSAGQWAIPGGKVRFGESLKEALIREIREETGIIINPVEPIYTFEVINTNQGEAYHYVVIDYAAEYVSGEVVAADDANYAAWVSRDEFTELTVNEITATLLKEQYRFP